MNSKLDNWQKFENFAQHNVDLAVAKECYKQFNVLFFFRILTEFLLSAVFIYIGINFLILSQFTLAIWPASGVALTLVFIRGYYPCLGMFVGAFCAYDINSHLLSFSALQAVNFVSYIALTRYLALKWIGAIQPLNKLSVLVLFLGLVALTTACHIFLHQSLITYFGLPWTYNLQNSITHFLAQFNGILCLTPLTLILDPFAPKTYFSLTKRNLSWWLMCSFILISSVCLIVLNPTLSPAVFLPILCIVTWGFTFYFKQIPTATLLLFMGVLYLGGIMDFSETLRSQRLLLELLLTGIGGIGLLLASYKI
tara:strand:- start:114515 stop:115444 length:930 start_codon:yes stop_codon:yes gene_type:complete